MNDSSIAASPVSVSESDRIDVQIAGTGASDNLYINNDDHLTMNNHHQNQNENGHHPQLTTPLLVIASSDSPIILDELRRFQMTLKWCALDHLSGIGKFISFFTFIFLTIMVPIGCFLLVRAPPDDPIAFNRLVQFPESGLAVIAFFTLTTFFRSHHHYHHHHHLLFLQDGLQSDSSQVQLGYTRLVNRAFRGYLACILLPSFLVELAHKILLFSKVTISAGGILPLVAAKCVLFILVLASWLYRTGIFLFVCVLFRLTCELQILRFQGLHKLFEEPQQEQESEGDPNNGNNNAAYLAFQEHIRIRKQLSLTSHRYRFFIIGSLVTITVSQFVALLMVLASKTEKTFFNSGDLVVCSAVQLCGFLLCLMGAARITHRAQGIAAIATRWHMLLTASASASSGNALLGVASTQQPMLLEDQSEHSYCSGQGQQHQSLSFQTRQALVAYLQHNNGGITLYGFALDRGLLHTIFAFEFSLVLWILSKVVVLS